jgi:5'-nucleotidase
MKPQLLLISLALGLSACDLSPNVQPDTSPIDVTVLGLNDFHGNLDPTGFSAIKVPDPKDATKTVSLPTGGAEVIGGYVDSVRAANPNTVFVGGGDLIGASPITSALLRDEPSVIALSKLGMKASALGNHEFDQGLKELLRMQNGGCDSNAPDKACKFDAAYPGAGFKWLGANVVDKTSGTPVFQPYSVQTTVSGAKIAFIGAVLKGTPDIVSPDGISTLSFLDEATSINKYVPELRALNVDAIIVLIHQGGEVRNADNTIDTTAYDKSGCTNLSGSIVDIAKAIDPSVSAIISGHSHQGYNCLVPDPAGKGRVVIEGDFYGHLLQRLDLKIDRQAHKVLEVRAANVLMDTRSIAKNADMTALVGKARALTDAAKLSPVAAIAVASISRTQNAAGESALGNLIADSQLAATSDAARGAAQIAFMNPGGIRADLLASLPNNTVSFGDVYTVQPFGNTLTVMTLTGAQIKALLEQQWAGQTGGPRILQVSKGFTYTYTPATFSADGKVVTSVTIDPASIQLNGAALDAAAKYRVVANNFVAAGGDSFAVFKAGTDVLQQPNLADVDAFSAYLKANAPVNAPALGRIIKK